MSTTVQDVLTGAGAHSDANDPASLTTREVLERVNFAQQHLFTRLAQDNRYFFATVVTASSTGGASARILDLAAAAFALPVERVLRIVLPSGADLNLVDIQDVAAELAPRAYPVGTKLYEVGSEWSAIAGTVSMTVYYVYRPAELVLTGGDLSQLISVPDRFTDYLAVDLAWKMAHKDFGRSAQGDPGEMGRLEGERETLYQTIAQSIAQMPGLAARRFDLPVPSKAEKS